MKHLFVWIALLLFIPFSGFSQLETSYDFDKSADFSKYKTYKFVNDQLLASFTEADRQPILEGIEEQLQKKGLNPSDDADLVINIQISTRNMLEKNETVDYYGYNYTYRWGPSFTTKTIEIDQYTEGTIFIDLIDHDSQQLVWQGRGTGPLRENIKPKQRAKRRKKVLNKIFESYPPKP